MNSATQPTGHKYKPATLWSPTICTSCHRFIFGIIKQGLKCENCLNVVHHKCKKSVNTNCYKMFPPPKTAHDFCLKTFYTPTFCDQCGSILWGFSKQGTKCKADSCGLVAHKSCTSLFGSSCGTIQHVEPPLLHKMIVPSMLVLGIALICYKFTQ